MASLAADEELTPRQRLQLLKVRKKEKNEFGEVFTPPFLIDEMLSQLPSSLWQNPDLKWLDPCSGVGNFEVIIIEKLMRGLALIMPDKEKRKNHILRNMIYMIEINPDSVEQTYKTLGSSLINIVNADFLKNDWQKTFDVDTFDVVVANPPYSTYKSAENKRGGGNNLWTKFVPKAVQILQPGGYAAFVHPAAWRKPKADRAKIDLFKLLAHDNQMLYLELHDPRDGYKVFNVGTRYDWYVLCKQRATESTIVIDDKGKRSIIDLRDWRFLPNSNINVIKHLIAKKHDEVCQIIFSRSQFGSDKKERVSSKKTDKFKYPLIAATNKTGIRYYYASTKTPDIKNFVKMFGVSKVIFGDNVLYQSDNARMYNIVIDLEGKYGMTQHAMAVEVKTKAEADVIKAVLESRRGGDFLKAVLFSNYQLDYRIFKYLKKNFWQLLMNPQVKQEKGAVKQENQFEQQNSDLKRRVEELMAQNVKLLQQNIQLREEKIQFMKKQRRNMNNKIKVLI